MARSHFTARRTWGRWVGSIDEIVRIATLAAQLVEERGADTESRVTVEQPGLTLEYDDPDELGHQMTTTDLEQIEIVTVSVAERGDGAVEDPLSIQVVFKGGTGAVSLRVAGPDRTIVEGLRTRLVERVDRGERFPWTSGEAVAGLAGAATLCALFVVLFSGAVDQPLDPLFDWPLLLSLVTFVGGMMAIVLLVSLPWILLFPGFEWVDSEGRTRWDRWRRRCWAALGALILTVAGGTIVSLVT